MKKSFFKVFRLVFAVAFLWLDGSGELLSQIPGDAVLLEGAEKDRVIAEINAKWDAQKTEIVTAEIEYLAATFRAGKELKPLTRNQIYDILMSARLETKDDYLTLIEQLTTLDRTKDGEALSGRVRLVQDDPKKKLRSDLLSSGIVQIIADGLYMENLKSGKTASIYNLGDSMMCPESLEDLRWVCPVPMESVKGDDIKTVYHIDGNTVYYDYVTGNFKGSIRIDRATGLVFYQNTRNASHDNLYEEHYQLLPFLASGNITFPRLVVKVKYDVSEKDKITELWIKYVEKAIFNKDIPDREFQMEAPAQSMVVDFRSGVSTPQKHEVHVDVPDIVEFVDHGGESVLPQATASSSRWTIILCVNVVVIFAILFLVYRNRRKKVRDDSR